MCGIYNGEMNLKIEMKEIHLSANPHIYGFRFINEKTIVPDSFQFTLEVHIGPTEKESSDLFTATVVSPSHLLNELEGKKVVSGRRYFVLEKFDYNVIVEEVNRLITNVERESWAECVAELRSYFSWEYE